MSDAYTRQGCATQAARRGGQTPDARFECKANTSLTLRSTNVEPYPLLI